MHLSSHNVGIFLTHPAGIICVILAIITFIAIPRVKDSTVFLLFTAVIIAGIIGYLQVP